MSAGILTIAGAVSLLTGTLERQRSGLTVSRLLPMRSRSRLKDSHLSHGCVLEACPTYPCLARAALHISPFDMGQCPYPLSYVGAQDFPCDRRLGVFLASSLVLVP